MRFGPKNALQLIRQPTAHQRRDALQRDALSDRVLIVHHGFAVARGHVEQEDVAHGCLWTGALQRTAERLLGGRGDPDAPV